jgi:hypothetical protein
VQGPGARAYHARVRARRQLGACLVLVASASAEIALASGSGGPFGTYRMEGAAHLRAPPAFDRTVKVRADAVLLSGSRAGDIRVRLASGGQACDLVARLERTGELVFARDQVCPIDIQSPDARGHVQARLRAGRGRLEGDQLDLSLSCRLDGGVKWRAALKGGPELPALWLPETPVHGDADVDIRGEQDHSRAAAAP